MPGSWAPLTLVFSAFLFLGAASPVLAGHRIGVSLPLSGPKAESGAGILNAMRLRVDELNAGGGIKGGPLELVVLDDSNDPEKGRQNAETLAEDPRILAVIGHYDDKVALAAQPVYDRTGVVIFYPTISNPDILRKSHWAFGGTGFNGAQGEMLAVYLKAILKHRSVVVINTDDDYGNHASAAFAAKARRIGIETRSLSFSEGEPLPADFVSRSLVPGDRSFDAVVLFAHSVAGAGLIKQLRAAGVMAPIFGGERLATGLVEMLGSGCKGVHIAFPFMFDLASMKAVRFAERYEERFKAHPSVFAAFAYDGMSLIADAIRAKGPQRAAIRDHLAGLRAPEGALEGISGPLFFTPGRNISRDVIMSDFRDHHFHPALTQLRVVTEKHTLETLDDKVKAGEVLLIDQVPYFKIQVVYAGIDLFALDNVTTESMSFDAEFFLWIKWAGELDFENIDLLDQLRGGQRVELRRRFSKPGQGDALNWIAYKVNGTYEAGYDLRKFPFDTQRLPLVVAHKNKNANKIMIVVDRDALSEKSLERMPEGWVSLGRTDFSGTFNYKSTFGNPTYMPGENQADFSVARTELVIERRLFPYVVTLFLPLILLTGISMTALLIPAEDFGPRASTILTSLLGILLQHLGFAKSMPKVGYLVIADYYFLAAYALLSLLVLENCTVHYLHSRHKEVPARRLEALFGRVYVPAVFLVHGLITIVAMSGSR